jgi:putative transposase
MIGRYKISNLCKTAKVSRSGYYKWLNKPKAMNKKYIQDELIKNYIIEIHKKYRGTYGKKRICIYLNSILDFKVNHKRVSRLMKLLKIQSVIRKKIYRHKFKPSEIAENILNRDFTANNPLQKLCMDITYIPIDTRFQKFLYMNAVKDLYNNEIVAYDLSLHNDIRLVQKTLEKLYQLKLSKDCILHTDQGFQYTRKAYVNQLKKYGIIQSMSRRGNCWDNVPIENFFSHFKSELIYLTKANTVDELTRQIIEYMYFYNHERIQIKYGMSPVEYRIHAA